jgi:hypothetical protein
MAKSAWPRFSRRSQGCYGEVGSSRLKAAPTIILILGTLGILGTFFYSNLSGMPDLSRAGRQVPG